MPHNTTSFSGKIYLMPGMGAKSIIFKNLRFPPGITPVFMEWINPMQDENLSAYAKRLTEIYRIEPHSILLGVSMGGLIVREISGTLPVNRLIYLSTVKTHKELPLRYTVGRMLHIWNFLPYSLISRPEKLKPFMPFKRLKKRIALYEKYMAIHDKGYFHWAIENFLLWHRDLPDIPYLHIHGTKGRIFPYRRLKGNVIPIENAGHLAVMTHPFQINRILNENLIL
jgi:pimeloyl-ACP methyl ester carboxylesterase